MEAGDTVAGRGGRIGASSIFFVEVTGGGGMTAVLFAGGTAGSGDSGAGGTGTEPIGGLEAIGTVVVDDCDMGGTEPVGGLDVIGTVVVGGDCGVVGTEPVGGFKAIGIVVVRGAGGTDGSAPVGGLDAMGTVDTGGDCGTEPVGGFKAIGTVGVSGDCDAGKTGPVGGRSAEGRGTVGGLIVGGTEPVARLGTAGRLPAGAFSGEATTGAGGSPGGTAGTAGVRGSGAARLDACLGTATGSGGGFAAGDRIGADLATGNGTEGAGAWVTPKGRLAWVAGEMGRSTRRRDPVGFLTRTGAGLPSD